MKFIDGLIGHVLPRVQSVGRADLSELTSVSHPPILAPSVGDRTTHGPLRADLGPIHLPQFLERR
jgi:hypothetical protein